MAHLRAAILVLLVACGGGGGGGADAGPDAYIAEVFAPTAETRAYCPRDDAKVEARITELLGQLTLEEKIDLMHGASLSAVDGAWLLPGNQRLGIPGLRMLDGPRGVAVTSGKHATAFPVAMMRGATWDPELEARVGKAMAEEIKSVGANVLLAPTVNVLRHPRWGRAQETYSEDVVHMGEMAVAFVKGVQGAGVLASVKHFAANSIENTRYQVDVKIDERTLREIYLPHFGRVVRDAQVASVMSAYNQVNGFWGDQNAHLLTDVLRDEWKFAGFVESDWVLGTHGDATSVLAGLDVEMPYALKFGGLFGALESGAISQRRIDVSVRRILRAQFCYGLDGQTPAEDASARETPAHLALAREVAQRGLVLLENKGVLPFAADVHSIVVAGRNADVENIGDTGSSAVSPSKVITALAGLRERAEVKTLSGSVLTAEDEATVRAADAVVVVTGLQASDEGEFSLGAGDRASLALPPEEVQLIHTLAALHSKVVVVLEGGAAILTSDWDGEVEGLLFAFYPGSEGGHALADVLFGDVAPSGRLPFSIPVAEADLPPFDNESLTVSYGYFHGYRHLAHEGVKARYPFGYGLGYTRFEYSDLAVNASGDSLVADVTVTNTGAAAGIETVQLYVGAPGSRVERAPRDLRAWTQVSLAPGASERVRLEVPRDDLAFWDVDVGAWEVEPLSYVANIGAHAEDAGLSATFVLH
jgi:beta-glucosidase